MSVILTAVSPARVSRDGGTTLTLTGTFPVGPAITVTVGGVTAYSGIPGQGSRIYSAAGTSIVCVLPALPLSAVGSAQIEATQGVDSDTLAIEVSERAFGSVLYSLRRMFPAWYGVGPRGLETEPQEH